jgi:5-aminopentanamidase
VRAGVFQFAPAFGDVQANLDRVLAALEAADADLMVLPELCLSGYQFTSAEEARSLSEPAKDGPSVRAMARVAAAKRMFVAAGLAEAGDDRRVYNSAVLIGPGGWMGTYRKTHLFFEEKRWFAPGDTGFRVWDAAGVRLGLMICFDWIFPEAARTLALAGADVIAHPANLVLPFCPDAMITRSIENRVFTVTADRTGAEARGGSPGLRYIGRSQAVGPKGEILFRMGDAEEGVAIAEFDPAAGRSKRVNEFNDLFADRRPEMYGI